MGNKNYVGQYFVGATENEGNGCNGYDVGECVWQDGTNLLCITYAGGSGGQEVMSSMVVPLSTAKHFNWFKTFAEFYEVVRGDKPGGIVVSKRVPNKYYNEVIYHYRMPEGGQYGGGDIAHLTRHLKENPVSGELIVAAIVDAAEKRKARMSLVDSIVKTVMDAELVNDVMVALTPRANPSGLDFDSDLPF